jgi:hypothetical protein
VIFVECRDEEGYIPQLVTDRVGYQSLGGRGGTQQAWHWGRTYDEAKAVCASQNLKDFGLDPAETAMIVLRTCVPGLKRRPR